MPIVDYPFLDLDGSPKPVLPVVLTNPANDFCYQTWGLIDTGADSTAIPDFIAKALYHDIENQAVIRRPCFGIGGEVTTYDHTFRLQVLSIDKDGKILDGKPAIRINSRLFSVVKGLRTMILGESDFLAKYVLSINYPKKKFSLKLP